jgi:hypothetical protein
VNYTTLGYGDIVPTTAWQLLGTDHCHERHPADRMVDGGDLRRGANDNR